MDREAFEAWKAECQEVWDSIFSDYGVHYLQEMRQIPPELNDFMLALFEKAVRPYHYFLEDWGRGRSGPSAGGSQSPAHPDQQRSDAPARPEGKAGPQGRPADASQTDGVQVRVEGKTYESRYDLAAGFGLKFDDKGKFYSGKIPPTRLESLAQMCKDRSLILSQLTGKGWERVA